MKVLIFDIEANGFKPTEIFCICITDAVSREKYSYGPEQVPEAIMHLLEGDLIVGHYIRGYDCPVIEKLSAGLAKFDKDKMVDTLDMSKALTKQPKHSLAHWGEFFGMPKLDQPLFEEYTPKMLTYCNRDVEITVAIFDYLIEKYLLNNREKKFRNCEALDSYFSAVLAMD